VDLLLTNGEVGRIFIVRRATKPSAENFPAFDAVGRTRVGSPAAHAIHKVWRALLTGTGALVL